MLVIALISMALMDVIHHRKHNGQYQNMYEEDKNLKVSEVVLQNRMVSQSDIEFVGNIFGDRMNSRFI